MGFENVSNRPSTLVRQIHVDVGRQRRIDHRRLVHGADEIRQATLASPAHLYNVDRRVLKRYVRRVPCEAPRLHAADQRACIEAAIGEYRRRRLAHTTGVAYWEPRAG